jgi:hypothetical protein
MPAASIFFCGNALLALKLTLEKFYRGIFLMFDLFAAESPACKMHAGEAKF